jgi:hypothetical protein
MRSAAARPNAWSALSRNFLGLAAALIILSAPVLILRYERRLLAKAERALPRRSADIRCYIGSSHNASANTASVSAR